jgi:hypothetical protein
MESAFSPCGPYTLRLEARDNRYHPRARS